MDIFRFVSYFLLWNALFLVFSLPTTLFVLLFGLKGIFVLPILFLLLSLFSAPAFSALFKGQYRLIQRIEGGLIVHFYQDYRRNFCTTLKFSLLPIVTGAGLTLYPTVLLSGKMQQFILFPVLFLGFVDFIFWIYGIFLTTFFENTVKETWLNALNLTIRFLFSKKMMLLLIYFVVLCFFLGEIPALVFFFGASSFTFLFLFLHFQFLMELIHSKK